MQKEKLLTIVIPSYNTSKYLPNTIKSYLNESLYDDVEILMINDGSKDNTLDELRTVEKLYPNYIKVIDKVNGGHGSVINEGLKQASGKYFKVIDGDDWVDTAGLCSLVDYIKESDVDLILNPYYIFGEKTHTTHLCGLLGRC